MLLTGFSTCLAVVSRRLGVRALCVALAVVLAGASPARAQGGLRFFKNYFVAGDYAAAGVALTATGTGTIDMTGANIPPDADIVAAFLYWQMVLPEKGGANAGTVGAMFDGHPLTTTIGSLAKSLTPGSPPCWSSGGATGASKGSHKMFSYRADVLRFLQDPGAIGKLHVNRLFSIVLPSAESTGNKTPSTSGASLVIVYRDSSRPLRSIVVYDGGFTLDQRSEMLTLSPEGFFQASATNPQAKMTHIVAHGQANFNEDVRFIAGTQPGQTLLFANSFNGPDWDTVSFDVSSALPGNAASATITVTPNRKSFDCLSWSAIVFSTTVQDSDEDGLLDIWESSTTPLRDPNGGVLPNLRDMGADPLVQDLFVEVGYMSTGGYRTSEQEVAAHSHVPAKAALDMVATAFRRAAPRTRRSGGSIAGPINIHFDVGSAYQIGLPTHADCQAAWQPSCAIVPLWAGARGGDEIDETTACLTDASGDTSCGGLFPNYPGTVGWKSGLNLLKNQPLGYTLTPGGPSLEAQCLAAGAACVRRFDRNRKDIFRYALFAHALGLVRVDAHGRPVLDSTGARIPKNTSGIADGGGVGGGDLMVTLGFWDRSVGSHFIQASTLLHELGHLVGLRHGGGPPVQLASGLVAQPNCKPNYQSTMNYLFQVRGLVGASGIPTIDFSSQTLGTLIEGSLAEDLSSQPGVGHDGLSDQLVHPPEQRVQRHHAGDAALRRLLPDR